MMSASYLPKQARVVVCGAGVVGTSVAYHLAKRGCVDVVLLESSRVGSGTSWHGSGLVSQFRSPSERNLISYSAQLYEQLQESGHNVGWQQCGSLNIAQSKNRWISLRRFYAQSQATDLDCQLLTPKEISELHPLLNVDDIQGGVWVPSDGVAQSILLCNTLAKLAQQQGVKIIENCKVNYVHTNHETVSSIETAKGRIDCEYFVNCSGLWSHDVALNTDTPVRVPIHAALHTYITTKTVDDVNISHLPFVQDYDGRIYVREWKKGLLAGGHELLGKPVTPRQTLEFQHMPEDWERFKPLYQMMKKRFPLFGRVAIENVYTAPENFTPDGKWIVGESPEVKNYFVGCGMNGNSVPGAGGLGKALADWIVDGESAYYVLPFDIKRFIGLHNNKKFLSERVKEIAAKQYTLKFPMQSEFRLARKLRCSPLYTLEEAAGGVFGERMCCERALYFNPYSKGGNAAHIMGPGTFGKPDWFDFVKEEVITCRTGVGLIDLSSLTKMELSSNGTEVVSFLQLLCANDVDVPVNYIVQTGMLNDHGGYFMVCPTFQHTRIKEWLSRHLPMDGSVAFNDVTSMYTVLNVVGPKSKELMAELTCSDMNLPPFTCREMNLGYASEIMVLGFTNAAEPGYSIFVPSEYALHIYDRLRAVGRDYGLRNVGYYAVRFLRIEKFIPFWGEEMDCITTPYEVNRGYKVKLEKDYFIGKMALLKQKQTGVKRRLVHFTFENHDLEQDYWPWGKEPILRNGQIVGLTTSSGYGVTLDKLVCMGFVHKGTGVSNEFVTGKNVKFEIDLAGKKCPVHASLHPPKIPVITLDSTQQYSPKVRGKVQIH
uniref:Pyruvate dehydrogenase phosphatase regulatory subunit, mitochondrial n=1 Tax=Strigamia maritima TaxID=126957 RepID=T1J478_STRMM